MLVRGIGRALRNVLRVEQRCLSSKSTNPELETKASLDAAQLEALEKDICLLVDEKDNFIGTASKKDCHKVSPEGQIPLHRAFSVFLFNKRGDILMQRRSPNKVTYPEYYTNACCSHPLYIDGQQEDVVTAARRRLNFELGIPLDEIEPEKFTFLTRIYYFDLGDGVYGEHEIDHILALRADVKIKPNCNEISEYAFVPKSEFNAFLPTLEGPITPWFNLVRRHRLKMWWDNLHQLEDVAEPHKILDFSKKK